MYFIFAQINGEDVRCASHEHVVDLIRSSGSLVTMTVVSQIFPNNFQQQQQVQIIINDSIHFNNTQVKLSFK